MKPKYSVLVIDDQQNWRELLIEILADRFEVKSAESYDKALDIIQNQKHPFHVLVTDMRLKDDETGNEDGLRLIQYLNGRGDETKTIVVTGYATVDTARRALKGLAAFDYLEKRPANGSMFDYQAFQQIVHRAALEAEKKRSHGFTDITQNILVIDPDQARGLTIKDILSKDGYQITLLQASENLEAKLREADRNYSLIVIEETLSQTMLLDNLQHLSPNAQIVMLTSKNISSIINAMRDYPVLTAFPVNGKEFKTREFSELIHSAL